MFRETNNEELFWILGHNPTWWQSEIGAITLPPCTLLRKKSNEIEEYVTLIKSLVKIKTELCQNVGSEVQPNFLGWL